MGGDETFAAQEPQPDQEDDILEASEPTPPEPFIFETDPVAATPQVTPVPDLPLSQDSSVVTTALDLNEHAMDSAQDH